MNDQLEFRVLGPLEILADGSPVKVDAPKQRAILAMLLMHANEVVSTDQLLEAVWGEEQPSGGPRTLRYHIFKLREALPVDVIATRAPGYVLEISPSRVDALAFESLLAEAREIRNTDKGGALKRLDEALGLWRGSPYADFTYEEFAHAEILSLQELKLRAMEDRFDICIELGREDELVGDLQRLVEEHPRRERFTGALMLALFRSGRQADALAVYQNLRRELGEGLGIDPSQELQDLEERILLQDSSLTEAATAPAADYLRGYVLRGRIGEGAHGVVWRAGQPGVGREVAIKAIRPDFSNQPGFVRRFEMEAQLVASLEHPHIVSLFDFWRDPEGAYLVMPYLRGGDLDHLLRQGPLRPETALELIRAIGGALAYAHRRGVIHRDVTPHNVLLDDEGHPYLADFGVATLIGETGPPISSSPAYLSPEQHAGRGAAPQSDVYSLGVLTHAVLTGQAPVKGEQLQPVLSYRSDLAPTVDEIIEVATSVEAAERYDTPEALVADLSRSLGAPAPIAAAPVIETRNPYKGLRAFAETDAGDFFGRDLLESELVDAVFRHRLVGVVGPSGCGKSSLVRAGLIPLLRRGVLPGSDDWLITDMYPGSQPFSELQAALLRVAVDLPERFGERLAGDAADRQTLLGEFLPADTELLLIIDQFEELFTLTPDEESRSRFLEALTEFAADPLNRIRIVVTMRADFYDRPLEYPEFAELLRQGLVTIAVPGREGLLKAVTGPAQRVGLEVEPGLAERITHDVAGQPGGLPLLEYALTELFQRRTDSQLTLAGYEQTGGVLGALGRRAEDLYASKDVAGQQAVQQVFLRLVTVEEGSADTRRRIPLAELRGMGLDAEALQQVLDDYGSHRLLTFDRDPDTRAPTVEVAHEALLTRWDRLRTWIDDRRDDLVLHRRLAASLNEWRDTGERPEYLLSGGRLDHYETFAAESDIVLTREERDYMARSRVHADQLGARRRRRRRAIMAGFGMAALIATVFAVVALLNQRRAEDAAATAERETQRAQANEELAEQRKEEADANADDAREQRLIAENRANSARASALAAYAAQVLEEDPNLSLQLLLESIDTAEPTPETIAALHETMLAHRLIMERPYWSDAGVLSPSGDVMFACGPDFCEALAVLSGDRIWQWEQDPSAWIGDGYFSPDGGAFVALPESFDDRPVPSHLAGIYIFDMADGGHTIHQIASPYPIEGLIPNSSGHIDPRLPIIATAEKTPTEADPTDLAIIRIDLTDGSAEPVRFLDSGAVSHGRWTTDRAVTRMALGVSEQTAVIDLDTGEIAGFGPRSAYGSSEAISPDGNLVATIGPIRNDVWDIASDRALWSIPSTPEGAIAFSVDGERLVVGNQVWGVSNGDLLLELPSDTWDLSISADAKTIMLGGGVWNAGPNGEAGGIDLPGGDTYWEGVELSGDHGLALHISQSSWFGTAYLYELTTTDDSVWGEVRPPAIENVGGAPVLSPDGRLVAMQQERIENHAGPIGIYDAETGALVKTLSGLCDTNNDTILPTPGCRPFRESPFAGFVWDMVWLPDGQSLVVSLGVRSLDSGGHHRVLAVWDVASGELSYLGDESLNIWKPILDPSGEHLVVHALDEEQTLVFDTQTWEQTGTVDGFPVRFAPDGSLLVEKLDEENDQSGLVFLESVTWEELGRTSIGDACPLRDAQFSPDGATMAAQCWRSGLVVIVDVAQGDVVEVLASEREVRGIQFVNDSHLIVILDGGPGIIIQTDTGELIQLARDRVVGTFTDEECEQFGIADCPAEPEEEEPDED